jgi:hypothetical protein
VNASPPPIILRNRWAQVLFHLALGSLFCGLGGLLLLHVAPVVLHRWTSETTLAEATVIDVVSCEDSSGDRCVLSKVAPPAPLKCVCDSFRGNERVGDRVRIRTDRADPAAAEIAAPLGWEILFDAVALLIGAAFVGFGLLTLLLAFASPPKEA